MTDEIDAADIVALGAGPKRITGEEGTVEERSVEEVIKADRYGMSKGLTKPPHGIYMDKIRYGKTH